MKPILLSMLFAAVTMAPTTQTPHAPLRMDACMSCHTPADQPRIEPRLTRPCADMCLACHSKLEGHHPIGVKIDKPVPAPLLLTADGRNTCSTCHDVSVKATATTQWAPQSLYQRIVRRPQVNRTYYLVMRSDRGQLCRNCH